MTDLGLDDLQDSGGVVIVEWGDIVGEDLGDALIIRISHSPDVDAVESRKVEVDLRGAQWANRWQKLTDELSAKLNNSVRG